MDNIIRIWEGKGGMIILELSCGLGNQMFQYAMARKLQQQRGDTLAFNLSAFSKDKQRDYSLNHFNILTDVIMLPNNKQKVYRILGEIGASILNKMHLMKGEKAFYWVAKHGFFATFDVFNFYGNYKCNKRRIYIRGFFQSEKYFQDIEGIIKDEFKIITPIQNKNINILEKIKNVNSVCVHIRRGDYISNPIDRKNLDVCSEYYYKTRYYFNIRK